jgi:hypothetical protein
MPGIFRPKEEIMTRLSLVFLAGLCVLMTGAAMGQSEVAAQPAADRTPTIESRLRDLEYPELRKRTLEEIQVYRIVADCTGRRYKAVEALYRHSARGGSAASYSQAGLNVGLAQAELAWAEGRVEDAYAHTYRATLHGRRLADILEMFWRDGAILFSRPGDQVDRLGDADIHSARAKLQLIRAEKAAKEAGVDLTEIKRREAKREPKPAEREKPPMRIGEPGEPPAPSPSPSPQPGRTQVATEAPTDKMPTLESRLHDLEYPELRKRRPEELDVYKSLVARSRQYYKQVEAAPSYDARAVILARVGLSAELAQAESAWAEGRVEDAYAHTYRATVRGERLVVALEVIYGHGAVDEEGQYGLLDRLGDAQTCRARAKLQLIRAEKAAKEAGVDLTEIKRRESKREPTPAERKKPPMRMGVPGEPPAPSPSPSPQPGRTQVAAEAPTDKMPTLESRLRDLEYPELRMRTSEEIQVYKELAESASQHYKPAEALYTQGSKGGSAATLARVGLSVELAQAELAWAEGRVEDAYAHTRRATHHGEQLLKALSAVYERGFSADSGVGDVGTRLSDAEIRWARAKLQLIRAEKVAKEAGVDLTEIKRRESRREPRLPPPLRIDLPGGPPGPPPLPSPQPGGHG